MRKQYVVRLDMDKLPKDKNLAHSMAIAEAIGGICDMDEIWDEPINGFRLFFMREMPQDVPQAGVYWIRENPLMITYKGFDKK